jgi:hypothetical protein
MKHVFNQIKKITLMASLVLAVTFAFTSCSKDSSGYNASVTATFTLSGNANSSQVRPAPSNNNTNGSGTFSGRYNQSTRVMTYTTTWANLTSAPIAAGLYSGASGVVGTNISTWSLGTGLTGSGSFSSSTTLTADQETQLLAGQFYYLMSTSTNVSGEIRGQISATKE